MRIKSWHKVLRTMPDPEGCSESDSFFSTLKKSLWLTFVECFLYSWNDSKRVIRISSSNPLRSSGRSLVAQMVKNLSAMQETWVWSLSSEDSWRREWRPTPVFLPGESHGQRSLAGYSPSGCQDYYFTGDKLSMRTQQHEIVVIFSLGTAFLMERRQSRVIWGKVATFPLTPERLSCIDWF